MNASECDEVVIGYICVYIFIIISNQNNIYDLRFYSTAPAAYMLIFHVIS